MEQKPYSELTYKVIGAAMKVHNLNFGRERLEYKRIFPPKKFQDWQERAKRYAWTPQKGHLFIRSVSVGRSEVRH